MCLSVTNYMEEFTEEHKRKISEWESQYSPITGRLDPEAFGRILNKVSFPANIEILQPD
jgi:hypothetical protein